MRKVQWSCEASPRRDPGRPAGCLQQRRYSDGGAPLHNGRGHIPVSQLLPSAERPAPRRARGEQQRAPGASRRRAWNSSHLDWLQGKWRFRRSAWPGNRYWAARARRSACACIHGPARSGALASSGRGAGPERFECHRSAAGNDGFCPRTRAPAVAVRGAERHHRRWIPRAQFVRRSAECAW